MVSRCRFADCDWEGNSDFLFEHCEYFHKRYIREIENGNQFSFTFAEILEQNTYLLCGENGMYWFIQRDTSNGFEKGVFAISDSEIIDYTLKMGRYSSGNVYIFKSVPVHQENSTDPESYPFEFSPAFITHMIENIEPKAVLYFGEYDKSDDLYYGNSTHVVWNDQEEELNAQFVEKLICSVCLEYIKKSARYCERKHFMCSNCFDELFKRKQLKCPTCRGAFLYDCQSDELDAMLKWLKFPEN